MKKLYGIGTGPGDPELLTLKAVRTIKEASIIFAPNNKGLNMAVDTARDYIGETRLRLIDLPMGQVTKEDYEKAAEIIYEEIPKGEYGVFLTIGDPMIYSTFIYIMDELSSKDIEVKVIPGIPSFVAAASKAKMPLTLKGESFLLCDELWERSIPKADSLVLLKTLRDKEHTLNILEEQGFEYCYIKRATLPEEEVLKTRDEILKDKDYMSLIIARQKEEV